MVQLLLLQLCALFKLPSAPGKGGKKIRLPYRQVSEAPEADHGGPGGGLMGRVGNERIRNRVTQK